MHFVSSILYLSLFPTIFASPFPEQDDIIESPNTDLFASTDINSDDLIAASQTGTRNNYAAPGEFSSGGTIMDVYQPMMNSILVAEKKNPRKGRWRIRKGVLPPEGALPPTWTVGEMRGLLGKMGNWIDQQLDELGQNDDGTPRQFTGLTDIDLNKLFAASLGFAAGVGITATGPELSAGMSAAFPVLLDGLMILILF